MSKRLICAVALAASVAAPAAWAEPHLGEMLAQRLPKQDTVDLRPKIAALGLSVRDQGARPTSAAFAMAFVLDYAYRARTPADALANAPVISAEFVNWEGNGGIGVAGDGGYLQDMANGFGLFGAMAEAQVPYAPAFADANVPSDARTKGAHFLQGDWIERPLDGRYGAEAATVEDMVRALDAGVPSAVSLRIKAAPQTITIDGLKVWDRLAAPDRDFANYSVVLVGYQRNPSSPGGGWFIARTALGPGAGDKGYVYLSFRYVGDNLAEAVLVPIRDLPFPLPQPDTTPAVKTVGYAPPVAGREMAQAAAGLSGLSK